MPTCTLHSLILNHLVCQALWVHQGIQKGGYLGDAMRMASGAGPVARQSWLSQPRFRDAEVRRAKHDAAARAGCVGRMTGAICLCR